MSKKGDVSFQVIVFAILALLVLIILAVIFHKQIGQIFSNISNLISQTAQAGKGVNVSEMIK